MTKPTGSLSLEKLTARMAKRIASDGRGNLRALILDRVDERFPDLREKCRHRAEYQAGVASVLGQIEPQVGQYVGEMDEESFSKLCTRTGRNFPEPSPASWSTITPLELEGGAELLGLSADRESFKELLKAFRKK